MLFVTLLLGLLGVIPTLILLVGWTSRSLLGIITWNAVYRQLDDFVRKYRLSDNEQDPDTLISVGYGGAILAVYLRQFFPRSPLVHVELNVDPGNHIREIDREVLTDVGGSSALIIAGLSQTGWALETVLSAIAGQNPSCRVKSYVFLNLPFPESPDLSEGAFARPDYYSIQKRRARLPWYVARIPASRKIKSTLQAGGTGMLSSHDKAPKTITNARKISIDLTQSNERLSMRSPVVLATLVRYIRNKAALAGRFNVAIAGPGAIGKSELAQSLASYLDDTTYLPLDASVLDYQHRDSQSVNGYQFKAYDIAKARGWIAALERGESFEVSPFDHSTRTCHGEIRIDGKAKIRIVEWVFALSNELDWSPDLKIVLDADEEGRFRFLYDRFTEQRHRQLSDVMLAEVHSRVDSAKTEVDPTIQQFDVKFVLDPHRRLLEIHCNIAELNEELQRTLLTSENWVSDMQKNDRQQSAR
jgi:uridine kinase/hypoxanthine phosphoribosyltransferase